MKLGLLGKNWNTVPSETQTLKNEKMQTKAIGPHIILS
jgi:hypothetical protein